MQNLTVHKLREILLSVTATWRQALTLPFSLMAFRLFIQTKQYAYVHIIYCHLSLLSLRFTKNSTPEKFPEKERNISVRYALYTYNI